MNQPHVQRRLAAILAADVASYSRLMGEDEEPTLVKITAHLTELIEPCIAEHRRREAKTTGVVCSRSLPAWWMSCAALPRLKKSWRGAK